MSNLYGQKSYNNYHYNQKREEPHKVLGTTFNPYQPKVSNQVIQEQYNQSLSSTLFRGKTPKKNQANKTSKRSSSTAPLISNSYNIINNNPYSRSPNFNTYVNGYSNKRDHIKDLLNLTGRDTISFYKINNKHNYSRQNLLENKPIINNIKVMNNY